MKQKLFYLWLIFWLVTVTTYTQAQFLSFNINKWTGENQDVELSSIHKITFSEEDLILNYVSEDTENIEMLSIRKITFNTDNTDITNTSGIENKIWVSPNPFRNHIKINNLPEGRSEIRIFSISGKLILQTELYDSSTIDINHLTEGIYVLKVNNQTLKIVKQ